MSTVPMIFTLVRLLGSLFFLPPLFMIILPLRNLGANVFVAAIFVLLGSTDFFDGYYARLYQQETLMGRILDPLADKVFITATLVSLVALGNLGCYWVILFICRDFFVMGLREIALHRGFSIPVINIGKVKTAIQICFLGYTIVNPCAGLGWQAPWWKGVELILLILALFLTLVSAYFYYRNFRLQLAEKKGRRICTFLK